MQRDPRTDPREGDVLYQANGTRQLLVDKVDGVEVAYRKQPMLFGEDEDVKLGNTAVANAFRDRLRDVAGFKHVLEPMPMRNSNNAIVYYLFFASQQPVASKIVKDIFASYQNRRA